MLVFTEDECCRTFFDDRSISFKCKETVFSSLTEPRPAELTSDQSPVFHCGQRNSLQGWTVSFSLWLHLLSSPAASDAFRHAAPRRRLPPPQLLEHCNRNVSASAFVNTWTQWAMTFEPASLPLTTASTPILRGCSLHGSSPCPLVSVDHCSNGRPPSGSYCLHGWF